MIGFNEVRVEGVRVRIDLTTVVDVAAETGVVGLEAVTVTARAPIVQRDLTYSQVNISADEISRLPVEEFEDLLAVQAGVVVGSNGGLHVRGGRSNELAYMVDGVPVTDPLFQGVAVEIENQSIQELQFISGTFNAEYGQAMSGVVNIVTKDGDFKGYNGSLRLYQGDYWSRDTSIYAAPVSRFDLQGLRDVQATLSGPLPFSGGRGALFLSGRFFQDEGYLYGERRFLTNSLVRLTDPVRWVVDTLGGGDFVPMNWEEQLSGQGKLSLKPSPRTTFSINVMASTTRFRTYAHKFKWNPDGDYQRFRTNRSVIAKFEQGISASSYLIASYAQTERESWNYVFENPLDSSYNVDPDVFAQASGLRFYIGGIRMGQGRSRSRVQTSMLELVSQVNALHQLKVGVERRALDLHQESLSILYSNRTGFQPQVDSIGLNFDSYNRFPMQVAGYLQDKIEYQDLVINLGLRYDFFQPDGVTLSDPADPNVLEPLRPIHQYRDENGDGEISLDERRSDNLQTEAERRAYWYQPVSPRQQISPRVALAFPISDRGMLHFSYGHFFQIPPNRFLYVNPDFEVEDGGLTRMGNAELDAERTTQYEVGLKQQIGTNMGLSLTGFYKDIRNLLGTQIHDSFAAGTRYALYINREYGNVQGITVALTKRPPGIFTGRLDYTYSVAEGSASDPDVAYFDATNGNEPEKQLVPLDWDQTHTLNATLTISGQRDYGLSFIGRYGSGLPYTPALAGTRLYFENSERKPQQMNVDLHGFWNLTIMGIRASVHLNVYNLLDRRNEESVYGDTGRATYSLRPTYLPQDQGYNTLDEYLVRPDYYSAPRQIKVGLTARF